MTPDGHPIEPAANACERQLLERFARGEAGAFDRIVELHHVRVHRLAARLLGWSAEVDDVVQEVFLAVLKQLGQFRGESSLSSWLTAITLNQCRSHRRRLMSRLRMIKRLWQSPTSNASAVDDEMAAHVRAAIQSLSQADREIIVLHHLEQMPLQDLADLLNIRRNTLEVRLHRARQLLKPRLAGLWEEGK